MSDSDKISIFKRIKIQSEPLVPLVKTLEETLGQARAHTITRKAMRNWTRQIYQKVRKNFSGNPIDLIEMGIVMFAEGGVQDYEILKRTDTSIDFNVTRCGYADFYQNLGEPGIGFLLLCDLDFAMAEGLGPDIEFQRTQTIMQGANFCDFRYRRKFEE